MSFKHFKNQKRRLLWSFKVSALGDHNHQKKKIVYTPCWLIIEKAAAAAAGVGSFDNQFLLRGVSQ